MKKLTLKYIGEIHNVFLYGEYYDIYIEQEIPFLVFNFEGLKMSESFIMNNFDITTRK